MPSLIEYKLEYLSRLFASLTHLPQALCTTTIMIMIIVIRVSFIVLMHTQNLNLKWVVTLNWLEVSKAYVVYDISSTLFFMHKPMEHANMCSKLSVFERGRIKTCASLSRPCSSLWEINLATDFLFRYIYGRSGQFLEIFIMFENFRNLSILFS